MGILQLRFESQLEPATVLLAWWTKMGMDHGMALPDPLGVGQTSTAGGYQDNLWVNLELWSNPGASTTVARLSARSEPFGDAQVRGTLEDLVGALQAPPPRQVPPGAFDPDSFTWVGGWDWTTEDGAPRSWGMARTEEILATAPRGLCASDGSLIADATAGCKWGFIDALRHVAFLGFDHLRQDEGVYTLHLAEGRAPVPITSVPGVRVLKSETEPYSGAISPDGRNLALVEYNGLHGQGHSFISLIDTASCAERRLTWFAGASGGERIEFSPDGDWILVVRTGRGDGAIVVYVATGAQRAFTDITGTPCWWVHDGHLGLLELGRGVPDDPAFDPFKVTFHDFTTGGTVDYPRLKTPTFGLDRRWESVYFAAPHADGRVLVSRFVPPPNDQYSATSNLALFDLHTGVFSQVVEPFADPEGHVRRDQRHWVWNSSLALHVTEPPTALQSGFQSVDMTTWPEMEERYGAVLRVDLDSPFFTGGV